MANYQLNLFEENSKEDNYWVVSINNKYFDDRKREITESLENVRIFATKQEAEAYRISISHALKTIKIKTVYGKVGAYQLSKVKRFYE